MGLQAVLVVARDRSPIGKKSLLPVPLIGKQTLLPEPLIGKQTLLLVQLAVEKGKSLIGKQTMAVLLTGKQTLPVILTGQQTLPVIRTGKQILWLELVVARDRSRWKVPQNGKHTRTLS